jgi:hypothetical protein
MRSKAADEARSVIEERRLAIVFGYAEDGERPLLTTNPVGPRGNANFDISQFSDELASPLVTWELYFRDPVISPDVPSVRVAAAKFRRKVQKCSPISGRLSHVLAELRRKKAVYVTHEARSLARSTRIDLRYGLEGTPARRSMKSHWIPGREAWE